MRETIRVRDDSTRERRDLAFMLLLGEEFARETGREIARWFRLPPPPVRPPEVPIVPPVEPPYVPPAPPYVPPVTPPYVPPAPPYVPPVTPPYVPPAPPVVPPYVPPVTPPYVPPVPPVAPPVLVPQKVVTRILDRRDESVSYRFNLLNVEGVGTLREITISSPSTEFSLLLEIDGRTLIERSYSTLAELSPYSQIVDAFSDSESGLYILHIGEIKWVRTALATIYIASGMGPITFDTIWATWEEIT